MQIIIDGSESPRMLGALIVLLEALRGPASVIHPDDNPERGVEVSGGVRQQIDVTPVGAAAQSHVAGVVSSVPVTPPNPAAIFGALAQQGVQAFNNQAPAPVAPQPPVAPPPTIPTTANMQPPAPPASPPVLDSRGLPWDQRIHSSTKARNADGTWRTKRNVDAALVPAVEAELQRLMSIAAPTPAVSAMPPMPPAAPVAPVAPPAAPIAPQMPPVAPAAPVPAPPPGPAGQPNTFAELMTVLTPLMAQGRVTMDTINACLAECQIAALPLLGARQEFVPIVWTKILGRLQ